MGIGENQVPAKQARLVNNPTAVSPSCRVKTDFLCGFSFSPLAKAMLLPQTRLPHA